MSRGGWANDGTWGPVPNVDSGAATRPFRHKVLPLLLDAESIDEDRGQLILGWRHTSGFSMHNQVVVDADDVAGLERLARYLTRPPVSLARMEWDREAGEVLYPTRRGHADQGGEDERVDDGDAVERIDELEFLVRVVTRLPEPRKHSLRYSVYYSAIVRARRLRVAGEADAIEPGNQLEPGTVEPGRDGARFEVRSERDTIERRLLTKR